MEQQSVVEFLLEKYKSQNTLLFAEDWEQAKQIEKEQKIEAKIVSAKEAYEAGQSSIYCGCYEIDGCTNYEEWLYKKFKS